MHISVCYTIVAAHGKTRIIKINVLDLFNLFFMVHFIFLCFGLIIILVLDFCVKIILNLSNMSKWSSTFQTHGVFKIGARIDRID